VSGAGRPSQELQYFVVDAFASEVFRGNPAGVVILLSPLSDETLQAIAAENNLAETAFLTSDDSGYGLRWFTPTEEVPLCGHATLATAHAIFRHLDPGAQSVQFATATGPIVVRADGAWLELDLPRFDAETVPTPPAALIEGLGMTLLDVRRVDADPNYYVRLQREHEVASVEPDLDTLAELHPYGVAVTAPGDAVDFVSRYFAPGSGIPEDPVTGSIHAALTPYWACRLGRDSLVARQLSHRGGELRCRLDGDRVRVAGQAAPYLSGTINVPTDPGETEC
jgi:PhzF family phenazine biosynthesis protein